MREASYSFLSRPRRSSASSLPLSLVASRWHPSRKSKFEPEARCQRDKRCLPDLRAVQPERHRRQGLRQLDICQQAEPARDDGIYLPAHAGRKIGGALREWILNAASDGPQRAGREQRAARQPARGPALRKSPREQRRFRSSAAHGATRRKLIAELRDELEPI